MMDLLGSIANIIGENINKLIELLFGKKEQPKKTHEVKPFEIPKDGVKPAPWTKKRK